MNKKNKVNESLELELLRLRIKLKEKEQGMENTLPMEQNSQLPTQRHKEGTEQSNAEADKSFQKVRRQPFFSLTNLSTINI